MYIVIYLDSVSIGIPKSGFGLNAFSGSYVQIKSSPDVIFNTYGIVDYMSMGGDSSTFIYGSIKTENLHINEDELKKLSISNVSGKKMEIDISGTFLGSGRADVKLILIDNNGRYETIIDRKDIKVSGGQVSGTRIRGDIRLIPNKLDKVI